MSYSKEKKLKIVVTDSSVKVPLLCDIGNVFQNASLGAMPREKLMEEIVDADALFCLLRDKIDRPLLERAKNLKVIATVSVGYEHVDVEECRKRGIRIGYTPNVLTEATAELAVALLLATARRIPEAVGAAKSGDYVWTPYFMCGKALHAATVGVYGLGKIGKSVAEKLLAFRPRQIIYHNRKPRIDLPAPTFKYVSFEELLAQSDFLVICVKPSAENEEIFDGKAFKAMKNDAILVNVSRGSLVNHADLHAALRDGELGAAGLDVTRPEPLPVHSPLFGLRNCVVLPHIGSATFETRNAMVALAEENIVSFFAGRPMPAELL